MCMQPLLVATRTSWATSRHKACVSAIRRLPDHAAHLMGLVVCRKGLRVGIAAVLGPDGAGQHAAGWGHQWFVVQKVNVRLQLLGHAKLPLAADVAWGRAARQHAAGRGSLCVLLEVKRARRYSDGCSLM